ncbi:MAG: SMP-30/gluconolactonase/LRE family protein [Rhizomicrobium sp.]
MEIRELASGLRFPEGPVAMADGSIILVEIAAGGVTRVKPDGTTQTVATPGGGPNGLAIGPDGALYVCNNGGSFSFSEQGGMLFPGNTPPEHKGGRIERIDIASGKVETLYSECDGERLIAPNDIVFDSTGGFWFTDYGSNTAVHRTHGALLYARADGSKIQRVLRELTSPNGVGLSPDGMHVYYAETLTARLWELPLSAPGISAMPQAFVPANCVGVFPGLSYFDSLGVQEDGGVCVATILAGGISTFWPGASKFEHTPLPDLVVTNICWGGPERKTAFVTMSATGKLAALEWRSPGLKLAYEA